MAGLSKVGISYGPIQWVTPSGSIGDFDAGDNVSIQLQIINNSPYKERYEILSGNFPSDLTLNKRNGLITGTVGSVVGIQDFTFTVIVKTPIGQEAREFVITLSNDPPVWVTSPNLGTFDVLDNVNLTLLANDPEGLPVTYNIVSGSLPSSLVFDGNAGTITGIIDNTISTQTFNLNIEASDGSETTIQSFTLDVVNNPPNWITPSGSLGNIDFNQPGLFTVSATDPDGGSITYSLTGTLPPNYVLNSTNGQISGTAGLTVSSTTIYNFSIIAEDNVGNQTSRSFSITINNEAPNWVTTSLVSINFGDIPPSLSAIDPEGQTVTYSIDSPIPGLTLNSNGTWGGSATDGTFNRILTATDASSNSANLSYELIVNNAAPNWVTTSPVIISVNDAPPSLSAIDPEGQTVTYSIDSPIPGLTLNSDGTWSGVATNSGTFNRILTATDSSSNSSNLSYELVVQP